MRTIEQILLEHTVGFISDVDVIRWAESVLEEGSELSFESELVELASLPSGAPRRREEAAAILRRLAESVAPDCDLSSKESEAHAQACFRSVCESLVAEEIAPWELCRLVSPLEQLFSFPEWLGDFYSQCDWLGPDTRPVDARHLYEYAKEYLRQRHAEPRSVGPREESRL